MNQNRKRFTAILKVLAVIVILTVVLAIGINSISGPPETDDGHSSHTVSRGNLVIDIENSGTVEASDSEVYKSRVEGRTTIISILEEGTVVTEEDVKKGKVLAELDSAKLRDRKTTEEIAVQSAQSNLTEASESYSIQIKQNESDLKASELKVKFARMDLEKYLGREVAELYLRGEVDSSTLLTVGNLGGEVLQKKRDLESQTLLEDMETNLADRRLHWSRILNASEYISDNELQQDELASQRAHVQLSNATTAVALFRKYEVRKQAEQLRSDYEEALRELDRTRAQNRSNLAKAEVKLKSSAVAYSSRVDRLKKINEQIDYCTIEATKPGMVTYSNARWRSTIEEGAEVRERQEIIKIPNLTEMVVNTKIHESEITRIRVGQPAEIHVDALQDKTFEGRVTKVGLLPDSGNRWMNPDLKVYKTDVTIEGDVSDLKPGMNAKVRIQIDELEDVLSVPVDAVAAHEDRNFCFVEGPSGPTEREVITGDYNDEFVEIRSGLAEGDKVVLDVTPLLDRFDREIPQVVRNARKERNDKPQRAAKKASSDAPETSSGAS